MRVIAKSLRFAPTRSGLYWCPEGLLEADKVELLGRCQSLRTIDEHAADIGARLGLGTADIRAAAATLRELLAAGFLQSENELSAPRATPTPTPPSRIQTCAILTRDRPSTLARVLRDFAQPALDEGRQILIADDARAPGTTQSEAIAPVLGRAERQFWTETITNPQLRAIARWGLLPEADADVSSVGANMNAVMLACVDQKIARFDDDTGGPISRVHTWEPSRRRLMPPLDHSELLIHDSLDAAVQDGVICEQTPTAILDDGLGESLQTQYASGRLELADDLPPNAVNSLVNGGRVLSSMLGVAGDSGMASSHWYLSLRGDAGDRLDERYEERLYSRNIQRAAPCTMFSQSSFFMSTCIGLDLRECLPPFYPTHRNSDGLFGICLRQIAPDAFRAYHPYMVSHRPAHLRTLAPHSLFQTITNQNRNTVAGEAIQSCAPARFAPNLDRACEHLGQQLQCLATQGTTAFTHWLRQCALSRHQDRLSWYEHLLAQVSPIRHPMIHQAQQQTLAAIEGLGQERKLCPPGLSMAQTQELIQQFGRLLEAWPRLRAHARAVPLLAPKHAH